MVMNQLMVPERWWPGGMFPNVLSSQDTYSELLTGTHKAQDTRWGQGCWRGGDPADQPHSAPSNLT